MIYFMKEIQNSSLLLHKLAEETSRGFTGKPEIVKSLTLAFAAGLHILIEDVSGVGKTTLVRCFSKAAGLEFGRIQFTPDLMPGDILGQYIWDNNLHEFILKKGSIFHSFILADEINRATARTQSALLEAMQERQVTLDGTANPLPSLFFVAATQNPSGYTGTFALPESQLDRFGMKISPGYPEKDAEQTILNSFHDQKPEEKVNCISDEKNLLESLKPIEKIFIAPEITQYIVSLCRNSRQSPDIQSGISTRGAMHLLKAARCEAVWDKRDFLVPEDVRSVFLSVCAHKITLSPTAREKDLTTNEVLNQLLNKTEIPVGTS